MKKIEIPFRDDMAIAAIDGAKHLTSRSKRYGEKGDVFEIVDPRTGKEHGFVLKYSFRMRLIAVATGLYRAEGFKSTDDFIAVWKELHPKKGFEPMQEVYVHSFERVKE